MTTDSERAAIELGVTWDGLLQGEPPLTADARSLSRLVDVLHGETSRVSLDPALENDIWMNILSGTVNDLTGSPATGTVDRLTQDLVRVRPYLYHFAWLAAAGLIGGFVAGVGSRLTMRLAGYVTIDRNRNLLTENDAVVGQITLGGTIFLGLAGASLGVVALLFYRVIRDRIPFTGWRRTVSFSWALLLVFGYVVMDPTNPDYHRFGPAWLNIMTFSSLYLLMGICTVQLYEFGLGKRRIVEARLRHPALRGGSLVLATAIVAIGSFFTLFALIIGFTGLLIPAVASITWLVAKLIRPGRISTWHLPLPVRQLGIWVVPGIVGFILTARGVAAILMNR